MRRVLTLLIAVVVGLVAVAGLLVFLSSRDDADIPETTASGPGTLEPDHGSAHDGRAPDPRELPTSGPHEPRLLTRDRRDIDGNSLLHALELGNVVIAYPQARTPTALIDLQEQVAGPFEAGIAAAGQAIILAHVPGIDSITALAWRRKLAVEEASDPRLREFADAWLGKGASR